MRVVVRKAVFPVAGLGTRFLPATKASPKEMLPIVDKPLIQYAVEEAVSAGISELIFITGRTKRSIEDHFDKAYELESELAARGKKQLLQLVQQTVPKGVTCIFIRQPEALGLGHAVLCAEPVVGNEPFAVLLADDLCDNPEGPTVLQQMVEVFAYHRCSVLGTMEVAKELTRQYGIVSTDPCDRGKTRRIRAIVEKPAPQEAPSTQAVVGRYVLTAAIFDHLRRIPPGAGGELQLTDAISSLLAEEAVLSHAFDGVRYDCGSKEGYLRATVEFALRHPEVSEAFRSYLRERAASL